MRIKILFTLMSLTISFWALADDNDYDTSCPETVLINADNDFGSYKGKDSSELTDCLGVRDNLKIVVAVNSSTEHGKKKYGQQIVNITNLIKDYTDNYGIDVLNTAAIAVIGYGAGAKWLTKSASADSEIQENLEDAIESLQDLGVKFYACQNTMRGKGWVLADLIGANPNRVFGGSSFEEEKHHRVTTYKNMVSRPEKF